MNRENYYELLHSQKRIWYINKVNQESVVNNIGGSVKIKGKVNHRLFIKAINIFIKNNNNLRMRIISRNNIPYQYIEEFIEEEIDFFDLGNEANAESKFAELSNQKMTQKIELENNKLYYFALYMFSETEFRLLFVGHHIAVDGWSIAVIQKQLDKIYNQLINNEEVKLDVSETLSNKLDKEKKYFLSQRYERDKIYWERLIEEVNEENYYNSFSDLKGERKVHILSEDSSIINKFISTYKVSYNTLFTALFYIYTYKTLNIENITLGIPIYNRLGLAEKNSVGMFTSTTICNININSKESFQVFLNRTASELKKSLHHQNYPYNLMIEALDIEKQGYNSVFKNSINYYTFKFVEDTEGLSYEIEELYSGEQTYALQIIIRECHDSSIQLIYDYKVNEYTSDEIDIIHRCISNLLNQIMNDASITIKDLKLVSEDEHNFKINTLNSTKNSYNKNKNFIQLFEEQVLETPHKIAVDCKDKKISYQDLNALANQMSYFLETEGVTKQSVISVILSPSIELFICILAILKRGAIYLPIDSEYPLERIQYEIDDSKSYMLLTDCSEIAKKIENTKVVKVSDLDISNYPIENSKIYSDLDEIVYIIYTSGSTGKPKGVLIKNIGLVNYLCWAKKVYFKNTNESMPLFTSIAFDLTVTTIFTPLISGNKVICYPHKSYDNVIQTILNDDNCTVMKLTPSHIKLLAMRDNTNLNLKRLIVGGEDLKVSLAKKVYESFGYNIEIYNEYGPTETVVGCMIHRYDMKSDRRVSVPIGYPADNVQVYVLNKDFNIMPNGIPGELYISGDGVAKGYLNKEEMTNRSFLKDPFNKYAIMYRTFDSVRYLNDGKLEYVGRTDRQLKINGYRIEIDEIEKYLSRYEDIEDSLVVCSRDKHGKDTLVAYIVSKGELETGQIKKWLMKFLPQYMLPTRYFFIDKIPITINGKVNHQLLPILTETNEEFISASNTLERIVVDVIQDVLAVNNVSLNDNFYYIGGDSITAIQIVAKLKELSYCIEVKEILMSDKISDIVEKIREQAVSNDKKEEPVEGTIEFTPMINWFNEQDFQNPDWYHQYLILKINTKFDREIIYSSIKNLINNEESFRLQYDKLTQTLYYKNREELDDITIEEYYLSEEKSLTQDQMLREIQEKYSKNITLGSGSLVQVCIIHMNSDSWMVQFVIHHLIIDGISWRILIEDFMNLINNGGNTITKSFRSSYKSWSEELMKYSKSDLSGDGSYWMSIDFDNKGYKCDFETTNKNDTIETMTYKSISYDLDDIQDLIINAREKMNIDLNEVMLICLVLAIHKIYHQDNIIIEYESHGRQDISSYIDISKTIGWFTSIYPISVKVEDITLEKELKIIKEQIKTAMKFGFSYPVLKNLSYKLSTNEHKYIRYNFLGNIDSTLKMKEISHVEFGLQSAPVNQMTSLIDVTSIIQNNKLNINFEYSINRFKEETIENILLKYDQIFKEVKEYFAHESCKQLTPSDFQLVNISLEDLDNIFN